MNNKDIKRIAIEQTAIDLNCRVEDLCQQKNKVVISQANPVRKRYFKESHFCQMTCYGSSVVASVDERIEEFMTAFVSKHLGFRCFDMPQLNVLNAELNKYNKQVGIIAEYYLPDVNVKREISPDFDIKILVDDEIESLYADDRFSMALFYDSKAERRDVIAVAGYKNGQIIGVAGASNDSDTLWQVGIDVIPEFRGQGAASTLTKIITDEILKKGIVPFYGTAWSNIASKNTAISSGYKSAWVDLAATDIK